MILMQIQAGAYTFYVTDIGQGASYLGQWYDPLVLDCSDISWGGGVYASLSLGSFSIASMIEDQNGNRLKDIQDEIEWNVTVSWTDYNLSSATEIFDGVAVLRDKNKDSFELKFKEEDFRNESYNLLTNAPNLTIEGTLEGEYQGEFDNNTPIAVTDETYTVSFALASSYSTPLVNYSVLYNISGYPVVVYNETKAASLTETTDFVLNYSAGIITFNDTTNLDDGDIVSIDYYYSKYLSGAVVSYGGAYYQNTATDGGHTASPPSSPWGLLSSDDVESEGRVYPLALGVLSDTDAATTSPYKTKGLFVAPLLLNQTKQLYWSAYGEPLAVFDDGIAVTFEKRTDDIFQLAETPYGSVTMFVNGDVNITSGTITGKARKITTTAYLQDTAPDPDEVELIIGDTWYDTSDNKKPYYWNGVDWDPIRDTTHDALLLDFSNSNNQNSDAVSNPTIAGDGTALDHTTSTDGSVNLSFEWSWVGTEADIDGFAIYVRQSTSSSSYTMGTTTSEEQVFVTSADKRAFIFYGCPANQYYTFGVKAYRRVDKNIAATGIIESSIIQPSLGAEDPYQPASSVAFAGDVTGTVNSYSAASTATGALRANTGLDSSGYAQLPIVGSKIINALPVAVGLNITSDFMGYASGLTANDWKVYIADDGDFYFGGNSNNYINWDGTTFTINGVLISPNDSPSAATRLILLGGEILSQTGVTTSLRFNFTVTRTNEINFYEWNGATWNYATNLNIGNGLGSLTTGINNLSLGHDALLAAVSGSHNVALGKNALRTNVSGSYNTGIGKDALYNTTGGYNIGIGYTAAYANTTGYLNIAIGFSALSSNTTGYENVAIGHSAMIAPNGKDNVAIGTNAMYGTASSNADYNVAIGFESLYSISTGDYNTVMGWGSAYKITSGSYNTALGTSALHENLTGVSNVAVGYAAAYNSTSNYNVAVGIESLYTNSTTTYNTAVGFHALYSSSGGLNTSLGYNALSNTTTGSNVTGIGYNAQASTITASNEITLGNASVTTLRCQVTTITALSDRRDKKDIEELDAGINFIKKLKPSRFKWNARDNSKVNVEDIGFIAQELKEVQEDTGINIPNLVYESNPERLEAGYGALIPVLVRAIQEQQEQIEQLKGLINANTNN